MSTAPQDSNPEDGWRARRGRRKERIRKILFGDTPRPSRIERVLLIFAIVATAFICYYFRLVKAKEFELVAFSGVILYFVLRRVWWKHKLAQGGKP